MLATILGHDLKGLEIESITHARDTEIYDRSVLDGFV